MKYFSDKLLRRLFWIVLIIAIGFLCSAFYIPIKGLVAQHLLQKSWQASTVQQTDVKPWPWADTWPVARLQVPKHAVDEIILQGDTGNVLAFAPGWHPYSVTPDINGVILLSAHRDTHFKFLQYVTPGDEFLLQHRNGWVAAYQVESQSIRDEHDLGIVQSDDVGLLYLVTCYPFDSIVSHPDKRLVVKTRLIRRCQSMPDKPCGNSDSELSHHAVL